jgi:hypothetical protein
MACSMDMLAVLKMGGPKGSIPEGMKVVALQDPNTLQFANPGPVLGVGGFTLWPMSYIDNRVSFGMVMYDLNWNVVNTLEKQGARYICQITPSGAGGEGSVTFLGQANQSVTMSLDEICQMLF